MRRASCLSLLLLWLISFAAGAQAPPAEPPLVTESPSESEARLEFGLGAVEPDSLSNAGSAPRA